MSGVWGAKWGRKGESASLENTGKETGGPGCSAEALGKQSQALSS